MFFAKILALAAAAATFVSATHEPGEADLDTVSAAFEDAGLVPGLLPEVALDSLVFITYIAQNGTGLVDIGGPGVKIDPRLAQNEPSVATEGVVHLKGSRLVAALIDADAEGGPFLQFLAWNLSVREDSAFHDNGAHLLNNNVTLTPAADPFLGPNPPEGTGLHRFAMFVWRQPAEPDFDFVIPDDRENFDALAFQEQAGLPLVNAMTFFTAEFQGAVPAISN